MRIPITSFLIILLAVLISSFTYTDNNKTKVYKVKADSTGTASITMNVTANPDFSNTTSNKEFQSSVLNYFDKLIEVENIKSSLLDESNKLLSIREPSHLEKVLSDLKLSESQAIRAIDINYQIKTYICLLLICSILYRFYLFRRKKEDWRYELTKLVTFIVTAPILCVITYIVLTGLFNSHYYLIFELSKLMK